MDAMSSRVGSLLDCNGFCTEPGGQGREKGVALAASPAHANNRGLRSQLLKRKRNSTNRVEQLKSKCSQNPSALRSLLVVRAYARLLDAAFR